jgi:mono/diheme cytochrome c family protein
MNKTRLLPAVAIALAASTGSGAAQQVGEARAGLELAQRLCSQCHAVSKDESRSPNANAPRFQTIASVPGMTATALSAALNTSHRTMPNIILDAEQQANIIAYILSLK